MKKTRRSAFTIVELVIVIAVIAILSAVLIPTFGSIIKSANVASDQTTAANLTTELHIYLKGNVITSEADLIKALNDPELGFNADKLTPKTSNYGYHYWYDMENQTIIVETSDEISKKPVRRDPNFANSSFRDVYGTGYYLIDMSGDIADIINGIDNIGDAGDYVDIIEKIESAATESNDTQLAQAIKDAINNTTIKNEAGSFFTNGESKNEYFSAGSSYIGSNYVDVNTNEGNSVNENATAAPAPINPVEIPSHIDTAHDGSLVYDDETKIKFDSEQQAGNVLANGACGTNDAENNSNTSVTIGDTTYKPDENGNLADENGEKETITLTTKLPFAEFVVGTPDTKDTFANDKIYVAYRNKYLQLHAVNAANANEVSNKVESWEVVPGEYGSFTIDPKTGRINLSDAVFENNICEVTVKATANNMNGEQVTSEINVVVCKPLTTTVTLGSTLVYPLVDGKTPEVTFNGALTSYGMKIGATYSGDKDGKNPLSITPKYTVDNLAGLIFDNGKLTFQTNKDGELVEGINFKYTITIDGVLTEDINLEVKDATAAAVKFNYNQHLHDNRPNYQIGTNPDGTDTIINLSDLFRIANVDKLGNAKVNIYATAEVGDALYPSYEIHDMFVKYAKAVEDGDLTASQNPYTLDAEYTRNVDKDTWNNATIKFKGTVTNSYKVFVEIVPEKDVSTVVRVDIVNNAVNVTDIAGLAKTHTTNVVLHKDVTATTGHKINIGANKLYGNGWIITATSLKSSTLTTVNDYFISVNGGTVDNVYINGPVYPEFEYLTASKGYHVSGIKVEGTSTVQNSYIAGFRQGIQINGGNLTLTNSTLYGGTYANLQMITGNLHLTDVTTVQPTDGIADTFNATGSKKNVIGLGIVVEKDAVDNGAKPEITIDGYFDQYNWVPENSKADFPTLTVDGSKMDMLVVLNAMFNGLEIDFLGKKISRRLAFLDAYIETVNGVQYLNAGIMFMSIDAGNAAKNTYNVRTNLKVTDNRVAGGYIAPAKFTDQELPLFSEYVVMEANLVFTTYKLKASQAMRLLEEFKIRESDGVVTGSISLSAFRALTDPIDVYLEVWTYNKDAVTLGSTDYPINQTQGYYVNYGN